MCSLSDPTYSLAERPALADGDLITLLDTESGRDVRREVLVALLVTGILGDEVEVLAADDDGAVHLGGNDGAGQDTATDGDEAGEGALLVCRSGRSSVSRRILRAVFPRSMRIISSNPPVQFSRPDLAGFRRQSCRNHGACVFLEILSPCLLCCRFQDPSTIPSDLSLSH